MRVSLVCVKLFILLLFTALRSFAGHERAGYISYTHTSGNTYHFKIITYTDPLDVLSDKCAEIIVFTNLSASSTDTFTCYRTNTTPGIELENLDTALAGCNSGYAMGEGLMLVYPFRRSCPEPSISYYEGLKFNIYEGNYTFSDTGRYVFGMIDPTIDKNVFNIGGGNSQNIFFALADTLKITNNSNYYNNSATASNSLIDSVYIGQNLSYNLGLTDIDNDSLSYSIIPFITGSILSTDFYAVSGSFIPLGMVIDSVTGNLSWQTAQCAYCNYGEYDVDILVKEYRRIGGIMAEIGNEIFSIQLNVICNPALGIDKLSNNSNLNVYPNPFNNQVIIENKSQEPITKIIVNDVLGRDMTTLTPNQLGTINVDTHAFNSGVYFIKIYNSNDCYSVKLIKE